MRIIGAAEVAEALENRLLSERLRQTFRSGGTIPVRHHHAVPVPVPGGAGATLLPGRPGAGASGRRATGLRPEVAYG